MVNIKNLNFCTVSIEKKIKISRFLEKKVNCLFCGETARKRKFLGEISLHFAVIFL